MKFLAFPFTLMYLKQQTKLCKTLMQTCLNLMPTKAHFCKYFYSRHREYLHV